MIIFCYFYYRFIVTQNLTVVKSLYNFLHYFFIDHVYHDQLELVFLFQPLF
jgi:hypothetical protein